MGPGVYYSLNGIAFNATMELLRFNVQRFRVHG